MNRRFRVTPLLAILPLAAALLGLDKAPPPTTHIYKKWAVAADHPLASAAGEEVLSKGGNAADAAAATVFALGVVSSASSGLGGGGFVTYYRASNKSVTFLDFREMAPAASTPDMFVDQKDVDGPQSVPSQYGGMASGVPGEPAGMDALLTRFGKVSRRIVVAPAVRLASEGYAVTGEVAEVGESYAAQMMKDPVMRTWFDTSKAKKPATSAKPELDDKGNPLPPKVALKAHIKNPTLAKTLRTFGESGAKSFYSGAIAEAIVRSNRAHGGIMTKEDLANYKVIERKPLDAMRMGYRWVTAPPPSAGGYTLLASLALLEKWIPKAHYADRGPARMHFMAESWKGPFTDRMEYFGDPDFVSVPLDALNDGKRVATRAEIYRPTLAMDPTFYEQKIEMPATRPANFHEDHGTTHLCVVDSEGNVAAVTSTVNLYFGARYTAAGFVMNDQMDDFASDVGKKNAFGLVGGAPNLPGPGKRPVSTMSPTIVFDADGPVLCVGGSGGSRIVTAVEQVAFNALLSGMSLDEAVTAPRIHHQGQPNRLRFEKKSMPPVADLEFLATRGHVLERGPANAVVQAIRIHRAKDGQVTLEAASDFRKGGAPAGK
jgi:gamma-glutamyltranspeptidase/glutathione hydrolase